MTQQNSNIQQSSSDEDEIDLIALVKTLWNGRRTVIKTTLIFMVIGLFIAIFSEKEYTASSTFVPQTSGGKSLGGNLGGLAAMAGINLGGMSGDSGISPSLYPQILNSIPFQKELLLTPLTIEGEKEKVSFTNYYTEIHSLGLLGYLKKYTLGLPGLLISVIKGKPTINQQTLVNNKLVTITDEEDKLIKILNQQIVLEVNDKDGYVEILANMPEAIASAEMALKVQELLQQYVINFKIQKSKNQLEFIKNRYFEVEEKFKAVQQKLANSRDRNQNITTAIARTTTEMLQDEYNLIYNVYLELAKQLEAQYIQVTEDTPVFTVLKPVTVPFKKTKPNRPFILIILIVLGSFLGVGIVFTREFLKYIKVSLEK